ncbi:arginyl-trna synthetase [Fusarium pseudocircinatum]|uniref:Arginyl-trna synthetase n=1 Tax=Fusarium pseudocircinatum TaxID=56676 RepID=A0A8H5UZF3_9HYPO|nr:arginyl-trna synthetase [Fusarium pseudocircinatum]
MASPSPPTSTSRNIQEKATAYIHEADVWLKEAENPNSTLAVADWTVRPLFSHYTRHYGWGFHRLTIGGLKAAPPSLYFQTPFNELAPRKKVVYVWICCQCGHGGMKITVDPCPYCGIPSYYDWVKGAIWDGPDEWRDQSRIDRYKISAVEHNKPFVEVIKERSGYDFSEISAFMDRNPGLLHWEHDTLCVEAFCQGADEILDNPDADRAPDGQLSKEDRPEAWVSDRNYWLSQDGIAQEHWYGQVLDRLGFYQVLKNERFRLNSTGEMIGPARQVYINNPDGASVLAILRTAPHPHADGLRDLLSNYISSSPTPNLSLRVSDFWNASFVLNFNLPFFAIGPSEKQDKRVFHTSKHKFRARYPLDSLNLQDPRSRLGCGENFSFQKKLVLHEAVYALITTGPSEPHWTAYCFDENFFEEDEDEESEDEESGDEDEDESLEPSVDPIIDEAELKGPMNMWLPRQYSLAALAKQLEKILGYHTHVHEVFKHNLDIYAVDDFLAKDVQVNPDGAPQGVLWQSLRNNSKAMKSLRSIKDSLYRLRATGGKLEQIKETFEELRREKKFDHADEQKDREKRNQEFTIAAFVFGILTLIAQVYSGKPQKDDPESWPLYIAMVVLFVVICTAGILYIIRRRVTRLGNALLAYFKERLGTIKEKSKNNSKTETIQRCIGWLWAKLGGAGLPPYIMRILGRKEHLLPK